MNLKTRFHQVDSHGAPYREGQRIIVDLLWEQPTVDLDQVRSYVEMAGTIADANGEVPAWERARGSLDLIEEVLTGRSDA